MLQPANRLTLIDAMRPPAGFGFESAMAVTYTMNLSSLLAVPAVLALSGGADGSGETSGALEPVELIHALRSHADKLTVFSQAGEIALPPSRRVFAFLEQAVVGVTAPRGGIVHPKVWVLRYQAAEANEAPASEHRLRVLISSRNLTFDTSWDTVIRLDEAAGPASDDGSTGASLAPIGDLFEDLLDCRSPSPMPAGVELDRTEAPAEGRTVDDRHRQRVLALASALREARFQLPEGVSELRVHVLGSFRSNTARPGDGGDPHSPLPRDADRSLIISPFLSDDFFTRVHPYRIDTLVSRPESLDGLTSRGCGLPCPPSEPGCPPSESLARVGKVYAFDDFAAAVSDAESGTDDDRRTGGDPGQPLRGLHAKVFAFEKDGRARLFLGSANATGPAFRNHVEVLVELVGSTDDLGIDRLCDGNEDERGLSNLFCTYRRACQPTEASGGPSLDDLRRQIAELRITGLVEQPHPEGGGSRDGDNSEIWSVTYRSSGELPKGEGVEIRCWPLAADGRRQLVAGGEALDARFETSLESVSGFLAFELVAVARDGAAGDVSSFVVPVPLEGLPEHRDRALMRRLVGNAERFLRYLLSLLAEDSEASDLAALIGRIDGDRPAGNGDGGVSLPVLEKLLRTMRRDPARLAGLHPLVSDLAADDALPPGFAELWEMIHDVATDKAASR